MHALYRMALGLPSLMIVATLVACENAAPPPKKAEAIPNVYLEALQDAEALRDSVNERQDQDRRIDELLGRPTKAQQ